MVHQVKPVNTTFDWGISSSNRKSPSYSSDDFFSEDLVQELGHLGTQDLQGKYWETRSKMSKLRQVYKSCQSNLSSQLPSSLRTFKEDIDVFLSKYKKRSIYIVYLLTQHTGFTETDLHGLTLEEAEELLSLIFDNLPSTISKLKIVTGKGLHSQGGQAVLRPRIIELVKDLGYSAVESKDKAAVIVSVK